MLRRTKEDELPDLPRKTVYTGVPGVSPWGREYRPTLGPLMFGSQLQTYNSVLDAYQTSAALSDDARGAALSALHKLRRISLHPRLAGDSIDVPASAKEARQALNESGRTRGLITELDRIRELPDDEGRKVIVFLVDKALQRQLKLWLDAIYRLDVSIVNGDTKSAAKRVAEQNRTRAGLIRQFEAAKGFNVIIMSPLAAGTGLTVVEANHVVHLERHWNPAKEAQATDRVYRIGQKRNVHIYLPAVLHPELDSFDVHLDRLLAGKMMLKDAVVVPESVSEDEIFGAMGLQSVVGPGTVRPGHDPQGRPAAGSGSADGTPGVYQGQPSSER
jgi:SNF2 family DNA or RNA helicase